MSRVEVEHLGSHFERGLLLADVASLSDVTAAMSAVDGSLVLFLAVDATRIEYDDLARFADEALAPNVAYVCAWGPGCDLVEVAFDLAFVRKEEMFAALPQWSDDDTVLTTSHADESLTDALFFAVWSAFPTEAFSDMCKSVLAVVVDNAEWATAVRDLLENPDRLAD